MHIGIDLVNIDRIKALLKDDPKIKETLFSPSEIEYCERFDNPMETKYEKYAARFGVKEAVAKMIKSGPADYHLHIETLHQDNGSPYVRLSEDLKCLLPYDINLSITHEPPLAMVIVSAGCDCCKEKLDAEIKKAQINLLPHVSMLTPTLDS